MEKSPLEEGDSFVADAGQRPDVPPGQGVSGGRSPILIRSPPIPGSGSGGGGFHAGAGCAGRATGRGEGAAPMVVDCLGAIGCVGGAGRAEGIGRGAVALATGGEAGRRVAAVLLLAGGRLAALEAAGFLPVARLAGALLAGARFAVDRFGAERLAGARLAVERLAVERLAAEALDVERLAGERLAGERLAVDFLAADFFFAGILLVLLWMWMGRHQDGALRPAGVP